MVGVLRKGSLQWHLSQPWSEEQALHISVQETLGEEESSKREEPKAGPWLQHNSLEDQHGGQQERGKRWKQSSNCAPCGPCIGGRSLLTRGNITHRSVKRSNKRTLMPLTTMFSRIIVNYQLTQRMEGMEYFPAGPKRKCFGGKRQEYFSMYEKK